MPTLEFNSAEALISASFPQNKPVQINEMTACCSADVYYGIGNLKTKKDVDKLIVKYGNDRSRSSFHRSTLSLITAICAEQEAIDEMAKHGWEVFKTWASCHGDYPVTLFGLVRKPFNEKLYEIKKEKNRPAIAAQIFDDFDEEEEDREP